MGPVLGIATAQAARNVLAAAGLDMAENSSVFLGHLPGRRGALGARDIGPGTLLVSQYLIREVIYSGSQDPQEVVFRILLFKLFNRIETWEPLTRRLGFMSFWLRCRRWGRSWPISTPEERPCRRCPRIKPRGLPRRAISSTLGRTAIA